MWDARAPQPIMLTEARGQNMEAIDEEMVLARAKERCEQAGFTWYLDFTPLRLRPAPHADRQPLSEAARRLYLENAREELRRESASNLKP